MPPSQSLVCICTPSSQHQGPSGLTDSDTWLQTEKADLQGLGTCWEAPSWPGNAEPWSCCKVAEPQWLAGGSAQQRCHQAAWSGDRVGQAAGLSQPQRKLRQGGETEIGPQGPGSAGSLIRVCLAPGGRNTELVPAGLTWRLWTRGLVGGRTPGVCAHGALQAGLSWPQPWTTLPRA